VAVLDRTRTQQRKFKRLSVAQLGRILGEPGDGPDGNGPDGDGPGGGPAGGHPSTDPAPPDDPSDPTDTISSQPPLESPTTGEPEPPVAPPVAP
jgi:proteasome alpha subunit